MKSKILGLMVAVLLAGPVSASIVTWNFAGQITNSVGVPADLAVGTPFQLALTFDTAAPSFFGNGLGAQYASGGADVNIVTATNTCTSLDPCSPNGPTPNDRIRVFNDFVSLGFEGFGFTLFDPPNPNDPNDPWLRWNIFVTGQADLLSGTGLPSTPDPQLSLGLTICAVSSPTVLNSQNQPVPNLGGACTNGGPLVQGQGISVPEPISLGLFGIGLAGLAWTRRRKLK